MHKSYFLVHYADDENLYGSSSSYATAGYDSELDEVFGESSENESDEKWEYII